MVGAPCLRTSFRRTESPQGCGVRASDYGLVLSHIAAGCEPYNARNSSRHDASSNQFAHFRHVHEVQGHPVHLYPCGREVPMVLGRMHQYANKNIAEKAPNGIEYELKRLHYDI